MQNSSQNEFTVCALNDLPEFTTGGYTHVVSILDPNWDVPEAFRDFGSHQRLDLRFNDIVEPLEAMQPPTRAHIDQIVAFHESMDEAPRQQARVLVHCQMGVSRSTATMTILIALRDRAPAEAVFAKLVSLRPQAWPNLNMIAMADEALGYEGTLLRELGKVYARRLVEAPMLAVERFNENRWREVEHGFRYLSDVAQNGRLFG